MTRKKRITEEIQLDRHALGDFKRTCNILALRYIRQLEDMMSDFCIKKKSHVDSYIDTNVKEPAMPTNIKNGQEMLYAIQSHYLESENDSLGEIFESLRTNLNYTKEDKKRIRKTLGGMGIGMSKYGELYIARQSDFIIRLLGISYSREMRRAWQYQETKTCNIDGTPRRCLVFDISGN